MTISQKEVDCVQAPVLCSVPTPTKSDVNVPKLGTDGAGLDLSSLPTDDLSNTNGTTAG